MRRWTRRVPRIELGVVEAVDVVAPRATQLIVDLDGTLLPFRGPERSQRQLLDRLAALASRQRLHSIVLTTNASSRLTVPAQVERDASGACASRRQAMDFGQAPGCSAPAPLDPSRVRRHR